MVRPRAAVLFLALFAATGCGPGTTKTDAAVNDGGPGDVASTDAPPADTALDLPSGSDHGPDTSPGPDGGADVHDCFPACVADLRASCQRPAYGGGSCSEGTLGANTVICYSNGVREIRMPAGDGGVTVVEFTKPDGQTICYRVVVMGTTQSFQTPAGQEVAQLVPMGGTIYGVTCGGTTTTVDSNAPSCRTLNSADCTAGVCP